MIQIPGVEQRDGRSLVGRGRDSVRESRDSAAGPRDDCNNRAGAVGPYGGTRKIGLERFGNNRSRYFPLAAVVALFLHSDRRATKARLHFRR